MLESLSQYHHGSSGKNFNRKMQIVECVGIVLTPKDKNTSVYLMY